MVEQELLWTLQSVSAIATTIGVVGTLTAAFIAVRSYINANKQTEEAKKIEQNTRDRELQTRQAQMFMNIYNLLTTKELSSALSIYSKYQWKNYREWRELINSKKEFSEAMNILTYYWEGIGVLVKEGFLDVRLVSLLTGGMARRFWEKLLPIMDEARADMWVSFLSETEFLYNELLMYLGKHPKVSAEMKLSSSKIS